MSMSDSSSLSEPPTTDDELPPPLPKIKTLTLKGGKLTGAAASKRESTSPEPPPTPEREPSPTHEYVLADNPDIAFLVMFRSRFADAFTKCAKNVPNIGPQDLERGVVDTAPDETIDSLLCALLTLALNRKKPIERGHHNRALEEAIQTQRAQWPVKWEGMNPLPGTKDFQSLEPAEKLTLLKALAMWSLNTSEAIMEIIKESYKQARHEDDLNQPLSVHPWGADKRKRQYWLIEGQNDTSFRLYKSNPPRDKTTTWWSVAGTIEELKVAGEELRATNAQAAKRLADGITSAIPRLEASDEASKRKRREYRQSRRAFFLRPEPGFSLYEGRTRGKRMKYTFSDDEDSVTDEASNRRSERHSGISTPAEGATTFTASGRQVRSRFGRSYGDASDPGRENGASGPYDFGTRMTRSGRQTRRRADLDSNESEGEVNAEAEVSSGDEWRGEEGDGENKIEEEEDDHMSEGSDDSMIDVGPRSLIVRLKLPKSARTPFKAEQQNGIRGDGPYNAQVKLEDTSHSNEASHPPLPGVVTHMSITQHPPQMPSIAKLINQEVNGPTMPLPLAYHSPPPKPVDPNIHYPPQYVPGAGAPPHQYQHTAYTGQQLPPIYPAVVSPQFSLSSQQYTSPVPPHHRMASSSPAVSSNSHGQMSPRENRSPSAGSSKSPHSQSIRSEPTVVNRGAKLPRQTPHWAPSPPPSAPSAQSMASMPPLPPMSSPPAAYQTIPTLEETLRAQSHQPTHGQIYPYYADPHSPSQRYGPGHPMQLAPLLHRQNESPRASTSPTNRERGYP